LVLLSDVESFCLFSSVYGYLKRREAGFFMALCKQFYRLHAALLFFEQLKDLIKDSFEQSPVIRNYLALSCQIVSEYNALLIIRRQSAGQIHLYEKAVPRGGHS
jgi:hypothetical protein